MANSIPLVSPVPSLYSLETLDQKWRRETYSTYQRLPETIVSVQTRAFLIKQGRKQRYRLNRHLENSRKGLESVEVKSRGG